MGLPNRRWPPDEGPNSASVVPLTSRRRILRIDVIDPNKTAIIVVDMQNDFVAVGAAMETPAARAMMPRLAQALRICRESGIKVIYTAHMHRRDGSDVGLF